mgnify:CR=1 FL=1|jgi:thioredoxin 1|tara:strand:- start:8 stop:457 length:450 start_codon:yes stop_codon:yes gene_type:complete
MKNIKILLTKADHLQNPHPMPFQSIALSLNCLEGFIEETSSQQKQPIIIFGANWCPDARLLEGVLQLSTVKKFLDKRCSILKIDVGNYEINTSLFKFFDPSIKNGIPRIFILDLAGNTINLGSNDEMRTAREKSPQEIFNYFQDFIDAN